MIRRISKKNDLRDIIRSCPTGVIDDITSIQYYIQGYNTYIDVNFDKVGEQLIAVIPTSLLETLPNGILMRKASYRVVDSSYPDGYYNLEFEDNMNIWLGDDESEQPIIPVYVTEDELSTALEPYATMSWVSDQGYLTEHQDLSSYATKLWVSNQGYLTEVPSYFATQSWVSDQGYLTSETIPSDIATQSWVSTNFLSSTALNGYATQSWVSDQGYLTEVPSYFATQSWVESQGYITSESIPSGIATQSWVESNFLSTTALNGYATESWVSSNFLSTTALTGYATESWVSYYVDDNDQNPCVRADSLENYLSILEIVSVGDLSSTLSSYVTQSLLESTLGNYADTDWVENHFLSSTALSGYATESWVSSNFLSSTALSGYATQSWVSSNFLSTTALNGYATESWVSSNFFEESQVWVGTQEQWARLTSEEKASYKIALVTA